MDQPAHEGAGGQHHCRRQKAQPFPGFDSADPAALLKELHHLPLLQVQPRLRFEHLLHAQPVKVAIGLGPRRPHRRALFGVEHPELDAGGVDIARHLAAEGVDLADQVPLGQTADGRIARHLPAHVQMQRQQQGSAPHAHRRERRLAAGMAGTDDDDLVVVFG